MSRNRSRTPPQEKVDKNINSEEKVEEVLTSLEKIKSKQYNNIPSKSFFQSHFRMSVAFVIVTIIALTLLTIGNINHPNLSDENTANNADGTLEFSLDFKIQLLDENEVFLSEFDDNPIILDLMATWCVPCKTQISYLKIIRESYSSVQIISVSVDLNDDIATLKTYKEANEMNWIVGRDITRKGAEIYSASLIPTIAFINSEGKLKQWNQGVVNTETLIHWIEEG